MRCLACENIYPPSYKECPNCNIKLVPERFAPKEEEEDTKDNPLIVNGEFSFEEFNDDL